MLFTLASAFEHSFTKWLKSGIYVCMNEENRFIVIETKLAHQEFLVEELNQVIYRQQQQIDLLENKYSHIIKRIEGALTSVEEIGPPGEKPPHY